MRSVLLSVVLAAGALGLTATPAQARADELVGPSIADGNTVPVAHWYGGRGFYRGYYPYGGGFYRPYSGFYRGYYPYGGFNRRFYYGGGYYPYGGIGGLPYGGGFYWW